MKLGKDFFDIDNSGQIPHKGKILIAEPFLQDTYFTRALILIVEHNDEGTIGFVLNKPVELKLEEILEEFPEFETEISLGGPVDTNSLHYMHTLGDIIPNSLEIRKGLYWGGEYDFIKEMIKNGKVNQSEIRFFLGYSGWEPGQLEDEIEDQAWMMTDLNNESLMGMDTLNIWKKTVKSFGSKYEIWSTFPEDPILN